MRRLPTPVLTVLALVGFAANSVLCRRALATGAIDAASFTAVRLAAGALVLSALAAARSVAQQLRPAAQSLGTQPKQPKQPTPPAGRLAGSWPSALALFVYAAAFSLAYRMLSAGTGALILFGCVQATMIGAGLVRGERLRLRQWLGVLVALGGLVALTAPGVEAPPPLGALLMAAAGVAWGVYSLRGRTVSDPLRATAGNFVRTLPFAAAFVVAATGTLHARADGVVLALTSGALASGVAYSLWYAALPRLGAAQAAVVQLSVPALAAAGGALAIAEPIGWRVAGAGAAILAGVAVALRR